MKVTRKQLRHLIQEAVHERKRSQAQASLTDQLRQLVDIANRQGLYDAADWLKNELERQKRVDVWTAGGRRKMPSLNPGD